MKNDRFDLGEPRDNIRLTLSISMGDITWQEAAFTK